MRINTRNKLPPPGTDRREDSDLCRAFIDLAMLRLAQSNLIALGDRTYIELARAHYNMGLKSDDVIESVMRQRLHAARRAA